MSFLHELLLFFINSFFLFPSHVKRIIWCFVYSDDHQHTFVYPSLQEESFSHNCVVEVDHVSLLNLFIKTKFAFKSLLNLITLVTLKRLKLFQSLQRYHHILILPLNLAISWLHLILSPLLFKVGSEIRSLNL
jgi:hypothetical protein